jgi:hypothetical protein
MRRPSRRRALRLILLTAGSALALSAPSWAQQGAPLAIDGYDPVAYFTQSAAVRGMPEIEYEWDEYRYRFSRVEHRDLFKADPARYAPQFANYCAMSLARGEIVEANPESWLISDGKLYLFGKSIGPALFNQTLSENVKRANENRTLIERR